MHMQEIDWFRAYVEQTLAAGWEQCRVESDGDGDYPFRYGTAACYVRVEAGPPMAVRVLATAAMGVRKSAKLLTELNELNAAARSVTTYWHCDAVHVEKSIDATGVHAETLLRACGEVGKAADDIGALVAAVFDGQVPFVDEVVDQEPPF